MEDDQDCLNYMYFFMNKDEKLLHVILHLTFYVFLFTIIDTFALLRETNAIFFQSLLITGCLGNNDFLICSTFMHY